MSRKIPIDYLGKTFSDTAKKLSPAQLAKAMRRGISREAHRIKRHAQENAMATARAKGLDVNDTFPQAVRAIVPKKLTGFVVTVVPTRTMGQYLTKKGKYKPIALWASDGTSARHTHTLKVWGRKGPHARIMKRKRKGHPTGRMLGRKGGGLKFIDRTERSEMPGVEGRMSNNIGDSVMRIAKKSGLI